MFPFTKYLQSDLIQHTPQYYNYIVSTKSHPVPQKPIKYIEDIFFFVKDRNLFHRVDTIGNSFISGEATSENITDGVYEMK